MFVSSLFVQWVEQLFDQNLLGIARLQHNHRRLAESVKGRQEGSSRRSQHHDHAAAQIHESDFFVILVAVCASGQCISQQHVGTKSIQLYSHHSQLDHQSPDDHLSGRVTARPNCTFVLTVAEILTKYEASFNLNYQTIAT